jgi:uncharacterized phage protein (TIGR02218 family)
MRPVSDLLAGRLSGATTLCNCWRLTLRDGTRMGFTDHDLDLAFDGTTFSAGEGLAASSIESDLGFAVGGAEVSGALVSASITEADIANGRYDGASVESWLVDWSNVEARLLLDTGVIGEVRRSEYAFNAEVRSLASDFDQPFGRYFQAGCSADLGDARCKVDTTQPSWRASAAIAATDGALMFTLPATGFADGWFTNGVARFTSGANAGQSFAIKAALAVSGGVEVSLWTPLGEPIAVGDMVTLTAGCDKQLATCAAKFANQTNFRGFPHIPGLDVLMSYANANSPVMDGGSLFQNVGTLS